jgi:hypothetical protein
MYLSHTFFKLWSAAVGDHSIERGRVEMVVELANGGISVNGITYWTSIKGAICSIKRAKLGNRENSVPLDSSDYENQ